MKIRTDYITNSSSSSYIMAYKIDDCSELRKYMKKEHGKYGIKTYKEYLTLGKKLLQELEDPDSEVCEELGMYDEDSEIPFDIEEDKFYIYGSRISYTNEGDTDSESMNLVDMIPDKYKEVVYEGDSD